MPNINSLVEALVQRFRPSGLGIFSGIMPVTNVDGVAEDYEVYELGQFTLNAAALTDAWINTSNLRYVVHNLHLARISGDRTLDALYLKSQVTGQQVKYFTQTAASDLYMTSAQIAIPLVLDPQIILRPSVTGGSASTVWAVRMFGYALPVRKS